MSINADLLGITISSGDGDRTVGDLVWAASLLPPSVNIAAASYFLDGIPEDAGGGEDVFVWGFLASLCEAAAVAGWVETLAGLAIEQGAFRHRAMAQAAENFATNLWVVFSTMGKWADLYGAEGLADQVLADLLPELNSAVYSLDLLGREVGELVGDAWAHLPEDNLAVSVWLRAVVARLNQSALVLAQRQARERYGVAVG